MAGIGSSAGRQTNMEARPARRWPAEEAAGGQHSALLAFFNRRRLSPTQRRLTRYIIDHPYDAPFLSSTELASRVGVSQPSVTRLATALGYKRYGDLQAELRQLVLNAADGADQGKGNKFQNAVEAEASNLRKLEYYLTDPSAMVDVGRHLVESEPLCVLGLRVSVPVATYFGYFAERIHPDVRLITSGGSIAADRLAHARQKGGEWLLCFLLPRYPRETLEAMTYAKELGFRIVTVADQEAGLVSRASDVVLPAEVGTQLVFDSQAAPMVLAGLLLEAMADASPKRTQNSLENFENRAAESGLFVAE